ncbi:receptor-type tyrosine-protein phosphatase eta isoform X1 [Cynoglossus semilaevis]|uniref:receptor-type tyrosine-protein phosphatase eta isoform X1 n=2 Tax=Cynoglossus semilaevis TaxID=244447 RepID=UPI000D6253F7|nr:receptor-type tyrosine-protein phosphatase eta isoform X1 [Cynoglossus semilaevis]
MRLSVFLGSLLIFSALLDKNPMAACDKRRCLYNETETLSTTTTTVIFRSLNCNLSIDNYLNGTGNLTGLNPGTVYDIAILCLYCCQEVTMKPDTVRNLQVINVTTSSVSVNWTEPVGNSSFYRVDWTDGYFSDSSNVSVTYITIENMTAGVQYNISVTAVAGDGHTGGQSTVVVQYTKPGIIGPLSMTSYTSSISLSWMPPTGQVAMYRLEWDNGREPMNRTINDTSALLSDLISGTNYTITIRAIAADNTTQGDPVTVSTFTIPGSVQVSSVSSQGSNSSLLVSWNIPDGNVDMFCVTLNNTFRQVLLNSSNTFHMFEDLSAGTPYTARVLTLAGPLNASSELITNATFPNPPGPIEVLTTTTSSIEIMWQEPFLMDNAFLLYKLTTISSKEDEHIVTTNTSHTFKSLIFGSSYNFSVATVGEMSFESEAVYINMVTTKKLGVESVLAQTTQEDNITLLWIKPADYEGPFHYRITWGRKYDHKNVTTNKTEYTIPDLDSGTQYNFTVTPETDGGIRGLTTWNSSCTNASPVKNLTCVGPNTTKAEIVLSWAKPNGQHTGLRITVDNNSSIDVLNSTSNQTLPSLRHNTKYVLKVVTLSCGKPSIPLYKKCRTGITEPPIPPAITTMQEVSEKAHDKFTIQIQRALLNDSNGRVTHVGVLMIDKSPDYTSDLKKYLGQTYNQWRTGKTPVYLTTVIKINPQLRSDANYLSIVVGSGSTWEGYTNGALIANKEYQYALGLFTSLILDDGLVNIQESIVSVTTVFTINLPQSPAVIGMAVGATLGIFAFLFLILISFIIYWKRLSHKKTTDIQLESTRFKASVAVSIEDYKAYFRKQKADSNCGFAEEFEDLKAVGVGQSKASALMLENKPKNRYNNVLPYDCSRVKLSIIRGRQFDDYINANYMPGYNSRKEFIAAQGPLPATVCDFWRMIWEKNVLTLVMLTRCNEQGRVKCEQYWGPGQMDYDNITVTLISEIPLEDWTLRDFEIKNLKTAETRVVRQFHFTAWPDHGVPETTEVLIDFRHLVREHMDQYSQHSPTVIHCSAGVGRTGTLMALDTLIFQIERKNSVDIFGIVHELRMHRPLMVQTEDQYVFLHQCAMDIIKARTGTNVDLIYQNTHAIYENVGPGRGYYKNGYFSD